MYFIFLCSKCVEIIFAVKERTPVCQILLSLLKIWCDTTLTLVVRYTFAHFYYMTCFSPTYHITYKLSICLISQMKVLTEILLERATNVTLTDFQEFLGCYNHFCIAL